MADIDGASLFDRRGRRKYLSAAERARILHEGAGVDRRTRALCQVLALAGCRVSEALALTPQQLDQETGCVEFQTLKRRKPHFRAVPLPDGLLLELSALQKVGGSAPLALVSADRLAARQSRDASRGDHWAAGQSEGTAPWLWHRE